MTFKTKTDKKQNTFLLSKEIKTLNLFLGKKFKFRKYIQLSKRKLEI